nr:ATP-binding protein [uncultured Mediterraneibacter sp.]
MLQNIDINKMNQLMEENEDARQIISQLLKNHHTTVSMIAHEIRNPLTLISSSLQIMESQHPEVREFYNWNQTMEDVNFMCCLLNELSSFNNSNTLHHSVFSIEKLLKNIAVSFAISLDASDCRIEFSSEIMAGMGDFTGDKVKLEQVILNLLQNAKDAVGEQGTIRLTANRTEDHILICCQDDGCGIPEDKIDTIFDPFVTYKENGTGLGLSSAKQIIAAHGGNISVKSAPEKGTSFTVVLPI